MSTLETFYLRGAAAVAGFYLAFLWVVAGGGLANPGQTTLLAALALFGAGLALVLALLWIVAKRADGGQPLADEREILIEAQADRAGYRALEAGLLVLTLAVILGAGPARTAVDPILSLTVSLVSLSAFAGLVRMAAGFLAARRG